MRDYSDKTFTWASIALLLLSFTFYTYHKTNHYERLAVANGCGVLDQETGSFTWQSPILKALPRK